MTTKMFPFFKWAVILLMVALFFLMLIIIGRYNADAALQQRIYDHSEIIDTV